MESSELTEDVLQFIAESIDSVPHLEALLLLYEQLGQHWTIDRTAARLYVSPQAAERILQDLERRGLVRTSQDTSPAEYVYDPGWDVTGQLMASVAAAYRRRLAAVATYIHQKGSRSVREFARAFELKKDR